jgi:FlgD Ig-like domain
MGKIMKNAILLSFFLFAGRLLVWSNPVDNTPATLFSELVFDNNNNWTMEVLFPFGFTNDIDSVVFKVSGEEAKLNLTYPEGKIIGVLTSDSLSTPLVINRNGDKIIIYTYSKLASDSMIELSREDSIIFGDNTGATVAAPISGYSIMRNYCGYSDNSTTIDCLTKNPSLGAVNDTVGLSGTLKGYIYDTDNKPVTKLKVFVTGPTYFVFETPIFIDSTGAYTTKIFPTIWPLTKLTVRIMEFEGWSDSVEIEPLELNNICPDTVVIQNIHLKDNRYAITSVNNEILNTNDDLTLINYPNPFNPSTNFFVKIPSRLMDMRGTITIFNVSGQLIRTLPIQAGATAQWDGKDAAGSVMPSGVYYYRLNLDKTVMKTGSMILLK